MQAINSGVFAPNQVVQLNRKTGVITSVSDDGGVQISFKGEIPQYFTAATLYELYTKNKLDLGPAATLSDGSIELSHLTDEQRRQIEQRRPFVMPLFEKRAPTKRSVRKSVADAAIKAHPDYEPISNNLQGKLYKRVKQLGGSVLGLLDQKKPRKTPQFQDHRLSMIVEHLYKSRYLKKLKVDYNQEAFISDVNKIVDDRNVGCDPEAHIPKVSQPTMSRYLSAQRHLDPLGYDRCRLGRAHYRRATRGTGQRFRAERILESAQMDFTVLDLILIDKENCVILGRPTIGTLVCNASGSLLGFAIGFEGESTNLAAKVLRNAILPKDQMVSQFPSAKLAWECFGIPWQIVTDLGAAFISEAFNDMCDLLDIDRINNPAASPWLKAMVEQLYNTIGQQVLSNFPAYTKKDDNIKNLIEQGKCPALTVDNFYEILIPWVTDIYMEMPHGDMAIVPNQIWKEQKDVFHPRLPRTVKVLDVALGIVKTPTIAPYGIQLHSLRYKNRELQALRDRLPEGGRKVKIKFLPEDLGRIYVYNHIDDEWFSVDCLWKKYADGLSLREHRLFRSLILEKKEKILKQQQLIDAKLDHQNRMKDISQLLNTNPRRSVQKSDRSELRAYLVASGDFQKREQQIQQMKGAIMSNNGLGSIEKLERLEPVPTSDLPGFDHSAFDRAGTDNLPSIDLRGNV